MSNIKTAQFSSLSRDAWYLTEEIKKECSLLRYELFNKAYVLSLEWCLKNNHTFLQMLEADGILMVTYIEGDDNCIMKSK